MNTRLISILIGIGLVVFGGCSAEDNRDLFPIESSIPVHLTITDTNCYSRAPGDTAMSVNRILIIPFRKTDENLSNDPVNFIPEYNSARQMNIVSFPAVTTMLHLSSSSTYQLLIIGYNQSDYDFMNQNDALRKFSITTTSIPAALANVCLQPSNVTIVPEFFLLFRHRIYEFHHHRPDFQAIADKQCERHPCAVGERFEPADK